MKKLILLILLFGVLSCDFFMHGTYTLTYSTGPKKGEKYGTLGIFFGNITLSNPNFISSSGSKKLPFYNEMDGIYFSGFDVKFSGKLGSELEVYDENGFSKGYKVKSTKI